MLSIKELLTSDPYKLGQREKELIILGHLSALTKRHFDNSAEYQNILKSIDYFSSTNISSSLLIKLPVLTLSMSQLFFLRNA